MHPIFGVFFFGMIIFVGKLASRRAAAIQIRKESGLSVHEHNNHIEVEEPKTEYERGIVRRAGRLFSIHERDSAAPKPKTKTRSKK